MEGIAALADHSETGLFNGIIPGLNGIGLGVHVTMTPQHAAALMHHLNSGSTLPLTATAGNNFIKLTKSIPLPSREATQPTVTITQINGNAPSTPQSQALVTADNSVTGGSSAGGDSSGRSTPNNDTTTAGKLFVGGLSWNTSSDKLRQYFSMFGNVTDVLIMRDPITQRSRGFGFITFSDAETVDKVLKVPIHTLDGKKIDPKHATPKNKPRNVNKTKKIFVGGVSQDTTGEEVKAYFNQFGKVDDTVMLMDQQTKRHRGFGFVTFDDEEVVDRICDIHFHTIKNKKVECKKAQPKELIQPNLLLGKRMILGPLRVAPQSNAAATVSPVSQLAALQAHQSQVSLAALASQNAAAAAAAATYGKLLGAYPSLSGYRYSPYPMAAISPAAASLSAQNTAVGAAATGPTNTAYPAASLANVDMSSFQGIDWASMYGMGMYV